MKNTIVLTLLMMTIHSTGTSAATFTGSIEVANSKAKIPPNRDCHMGDNGIVYCFDCPPFGPQR